MYFGSVFGLYFVCLFTCILCVCVSCGVHVLGRFCMYFRVFFECVFGVLVDVGIL